MILWASMKDIAIYSILVYKEIFLHVKALHDVPIASQVFELFQTNSEGV